VGGWEDREGRFTGGLAITETVTSRGGIPIRLTDERWAHIVEEHPELAGLRPEVLTAIAEAERVLAGKCSELFAVRTIESGKALVVVYREVDSKDGFVITAFLTRQLEKLDRRPQLWPAKS
jgi:hypothetical protein